MCVTNLHDLTLAVKVALNPNTINQSTKLKGFVKDNFKFDENGRSFAKWLENTVGKGEIALNREIARHEQFSFSHSVFKGLVLQTRKNQALFGKGLILKNRFTSIFFLLLD